MDPDLALITGMVFLALTVPSALSALSEWRPPRMAAGLTVSGVGLIAWAAVSKPGGYALSQLPEVFLGVVARFIP